MKKVVSLLLAALLLIAPGASLAALVESLPLSGVTYYPEGAQKDTASFSFTYSYPQFAGEDEATAQINQGYQYICGDMQLFTVPLYGDSLPSVRNAYINVGYAVAYNGEDYISILLRQEQNFGNGVVQTLRADTYALTGELAGEAVTLPQLMGLVVSEDDDTQKYSRAVIKVNQLVQELVWARISADMTEHPDVYFENLTFTELSEEFFPESDFYLAKNGSFTFFVHPGMVAPAENGFLYFTFTLDELRDEL